MTTVRKPKWRRLKQRNNYIKISPNRDFPGSPVVKTLPSNAWGVGSIPGWGAKIPHASWPENQNKKQKQYCNKFNKDFKNGPHPKKKKILKKNLPSQRYDLSWTFMMWAPRTLKGNENDSEVTRLLRCSTFYVCLVRVRGDSFNFQTSQAPKRSTKELIIYWAFLENTFSYSGFIKIKCLKLENLRKLPNPP